MGDLLVLMFNNVLPLFVDDRLMHFMDKLLLDDRLVNLMNHRLMVFMQDRLLPLHINILVMLMNLLLMRLLDNGLVDASVNFGSLFMALDDLTAFRSLYLSTFLVPNDDRSLLLSLENRLLQLLLLILSELGLLLSRFLLGSLFLLALSILLFL